MAFFGFGLFLFNDLGLLKWYALSKEKNRIQNEINTLVNREEYLSKEIVKIKSDDIYLEKIAREKFQMVKPGEKVYKVVDSRKIK